MAKYSYELKKKIVEEYLSGKTSYQALAMKYNIEKSALKLWVNNYKHFGDEGLMRSRNNREYSVEFKLEAITRYETSECSYRQLALELGLTNPSMIVNWRRKYREKGIEGLRPHKRGRPMTKNKDRKQTRKPLNESEPLDASTREALENRIKELEAENEKLTIQKMFWEQLRSLEREEAMNKRRGSSPNSENNSN
ncbi:IS3 family transposase ISEfa10 [Aedoeadaptatus nemausensis]|uniref:IS3 family transposase ISEfa10 n=2 Tax=Aedoeadaptatus nemausensis TaxID=2582829 RepID=A0A6V6Y022_9FIRM|nr:helix-turn-helix domain-containing protein [Peptoniphilus nemausensis]CAC9925208.1 IS3 family transposase ISEfa10 [Peptoniphilus nemausensis]